MNNQVKKEMTQDKKRKFFNGTYKDVLLLLILAFVLIFVAWKIFQTEKDTTTFEVSTSEKEEKVMRLLQEIDGVGEASVVVCETENGVESVVVVCEGANDFQVIINVRGAVAAALGTDEKSVKIYLKN